MRSCLPGDGRLVYPVLRQIHSDGAVVTQIENLLLDDEADYLVRRAGKLRRSETESDAGVVDGRTSRTAYLPMKDAVVDCIGKRLATIARIPATNLEPLQITDYKHNQRYKSHFDDLGYGPNKRLKTIFAYLQADDDLANGMCGGSTAFYRLRDKDGRPLRVYPQKGSALMWSNFLPDGRHNSRTLHAGEPIKCKGSEKIGMNAWFWDAPQKRRKISRSKSREEPRSAQHRDIQRRRRVTL